MHALLHADAPQPGGAAKPSLAGLGREGLRAALAAVGVPDKQLNMRVGQLRQPIYVRATAFEEMLRLQVLRARSPAPIAGWSEIVTEQVSVDGTRKWLLRLPIRGHEAMFPEIETVYIPEAHRRTPRHLEPGRLHAHLLVLLSILGTQRLVRNLEASEIVGQVLLARDRIGDWPGAAGMGSDPAAGGLVSMPPVAARGLTPSSTERKITNVVLMGMGEPLYNFANVRDAMAAVADGEDLALSRRASRSPPSAVADRWCESRWAPCSPFRCMRCATRCATSWCRSIEVEPIAALMEACAELSGSLERERITFEYVMLKGVNDSHDDANRW